MFNLEYLARLKHKERILNVEQHFLMQQALAARESEPRHPFYYEALAALGRRLIAWGEQLQRQYDHTPQLPVESPVRKMV